MQIPLSCSAAISLFKRLDMPILRVIRFTGQILNLQTAGP